MTSEDDDDDDELFANFDTDHRDDLVMEWAKGGVLDFQPLEHLQSIEFMRPPVSSLGVYDKYSDSLESSKVNFKLAAVEEALALSIWTTTTSCRVLSLESGFGV
ncbi:uncharacterized protein LOC133831765 isoform X2 [Humulus lupulus]|uniref:uncharacterized protein LOC133831765 isoform X2 n=1 Tax=Humulus lupulus TaxID=3486 RepID=UPI002B408439|nr:uncharacterized protein LOC133831765 isoform X2 [Humulus lupulus]